MSEKHSAAATKRWAKVPKKERSRKMSLLRLNHLNTLSLRQKKNIGRKLVEHRKLKELK